MIYFVRHGSTDWNEHINENGEKDPLLQGLADIPLNENGKKQAKNIANMLKNIKFDRVISSPLLRAKQTCEIIVDGKYDIEYDKRIIERDFGEFEGRATSSFDTKLFNEYISQSSSKIESIPDLKKRIYNLLDELKKYPDKNYLIVAHGGTTCIAMSYFYGIPENGDYFSYKIPNGTVVKLDFNKISNKKN